jgi:hypothetical protein
MELNKRSVFYKLVRPLRNRVMQANIKKSKSFLYSFNIFEPRFSVAGQGATTEIKINRKCSEPNFMNDSIHETEKSYKSFHPKQLKNDAGIKKRDKRVISIPPSPNKSVEASTHINQTTNAHKRNSQCNAVIFPTIKKPIFKETPSIKSRQHSMDMRYKMISNIIKKGRTKNEKEICSNITTHRSQLHNAPKKCENPKTYNIDDIYMRLNTSKKESIKLLPTIKLKDRVCLCTCHCKYLHTEDMLI